MTEAHIGFLCEIASSIGHSDDPKYTLLRSHYLMKCKEATGGYGLPKKQFSPAVRCPRCFLDWRKDSPVKFKPNQLSKRQRKRLNRRKNDFSGRKLDDIKAQLHGNVMEKVCAFCNHTTKTTIAKPEREKQVINTPQVSILDKKDSISKIKKKLNNNKSKEIIQTKEVHKPHINVYTNALDIFSLKNEKNTLKSAIKEPPKIIKNNKKKKDKFAGLCQAAVLASAKLKDKNYKKNKLNLFLKPSSG